MKVIIVGAGRLGTKLATALQHGEIHVIVIDKDPGVLERLKDHTEVLTITANGARKDVLRKLNISSYDLTIAATNSDETNIMISAIAKKLGCRGSIACIKNPEYAAQIDFLKDTFNIDHIINPELATANEILHYLMGSHAFYFGDYAKGKILLVDFNIKNTPNFVNRSVSRLKNLSEILIVAISRDGEVIIPHGGTVLQRDDIIYVIGRKNKIKVLAKTFNTSVERKQIKRTMILGGSEIGFYLADSLSKKGIHIKIIESDVSRCKELAHKLGNNVLVIHGGSMDVKLLEDEGVAKMDAFVGATVFDEENLFMSLRAKQLHTDKVIAKFSNNSYIQIIEKLGIDLAVNPVNITASEILKYVRGGRVISVSLLLDGQAEVTEIIASKDLQILDQPIKDLDLPRGILIISILHNGQVIIPNGDSIIQVGDRIVLFSLLSEVHILEKFFHLREGR